MPRTRTARTCGVLLPLLCGLGLPTRAAIIVTSEPDDAVFRPSGTLISGRTTSVLGASSTPPNDFGGRGILYVFQLPASDTPSPLVSSAEFRFTVASPPLATPKYSIDLYAIPARTSPAPLVTDAYLGPLQTPLTNVRVVEHLLPADVPFPTGEVVTPFATDSAFVDFLNQQYGPAGTGAGKYIFLRLNPDTLPLAEDSGGNVNMSEAATGRPTLTLTFVPEPAALCSTATFFALAFLNRRARPQV